MFISNVYIFTECYNVRFVFNVALIWSPLFLLIPPKYVYIFLTVKKKKKESYQLAYTTQNYE